MATTTTTAPARKTRFSRRVPDHVTDELVNVLSSQETYEFNQLFRLVYDNLKVKNAVTFINDFETALAEEARKRGVDGVICGHIHHAEIREIDDIVDLGGERAVPHVERGDLERRRAGLGRDNVGLHIEPFVRLCRGRVVQSFEHHLVVGRVAGEDEEGEGKDRVLHKQRTAETRSGYLARSPAHLHP